METKSLIKAKKVILLIVMVTIASVVLAGCGIGRGPYRHGYYDRNPNMGSYGYSDTTPSETETNPGGRGYAPHPRGYRGYQDGYCGW